MHTIVCQVLEQVKQVILWVLISSFHPIPLGGGYLLPLLFNKLNTMAIFIFKFRYGGIRG